MVFFPKSSVHFLEAFVKAFFLLQYLRHTNQERKTSLKEKHLIELRIGVGNWAEIDNFQTWSPTSHLTVKGLYIFRLKALSLMWSKNCFYHFH